MSPLPKKRHSRARQGKRRAGQKIAKPTLGTCQNCGAPKPPHRVCPSCGSYKGRTVIVKKEKKVKKE